MFGKLNSGNIELLKWFAILFMIIDHIGHVFFKENIYLHSVGRLAFPLFAFLLAHNYYFFSKDKIKYLKRLLLFGIISQPIYYFVISDHVLNIFFTLFLGLLFVFVFEKFKEREKKEKYLGLFFLSIFVLILSLFVEYTFFGVALIISFYFMFQKKEFFYSSILFGFLSNISSVLYAVSSLISFIIIKGIYLKEFNMKRMNKYFFYIFYPGHLFLLYLFI